MFASSTSSPSPQLLAPFPFPGFSARPTPPARPGAARGAPSCGFGGLHPTGKQPGLGPEVPPLAVWGRARPLPPRPRAWSQVQTASPSAAAAERDAAGGQAVGAPRCLRGSMILPRALSCAVLLLLLLAVLGRGKRCSIARILRQYRAVIFHEIQNLKNLSGSAERSSRAGLACRSDKDQKILLAIYNISMSLRDVAGGTLRGPEEVAVWKVARNTEFVLRENCRRIGKSPPRAPAQPRGRRKQLKEISRRAQRLATCWEKLYALHGPRRGS